MRRGLFVTGTDTNVGKTVAAAALLVRYRDRVPLRYWKPIQTGAGQDDDTAEIIRLTRAGPDAVLNAGTRLPPPVSPHLAARLSGCAIDVERLLALSQSPRPGSDRARWIVEGAGGALVPITGTELMADLMVRLGLPVVVVSRSTLGTINHTLLTLEALRRRSLTIAGVLMIGPRDCENRAAIERYGLVDVIGEMPRFEPLTPDAVQTWAASELDTEGRLGSALGLGTNGDSP